MLHCAAFPSTRPSLRPGTSTTDRGLSAQQLQCMNAAALPCCVLQCLVFMQGWPVLMLGPFCMSQLLCIGCTDQSCAQPSSSLLQAPAEPGRQGWHTGADRLLDRNRALMQHEGYICSSQCLHPSSSRLLCSPHAAVDRAPWLSSSWLTPWEQWHSFCSPVTCWMLLIRA